MKFDVLNEYGLKIGELVPEGEGIGGAIIWMLLVSITITIGLVCLLFWITWQAIKFAVRRPAVGVPVLAGWCALLITCGVLLNNASQTSSSATASRSYQFAENSPMASTSVGPSASAASSGSVATTAAPAFVVIANTNGEGLNVRQEPSSAGRVLHAWPERTRLEVVGPDSTISVVVWKHVKDPSGNIGWAQARYTIGN